MNSAQRKAPELQALVELFYETLDDVGKFDEVDAAGLPAPSRTLLDHDQHMTVTIEAKHGCLVDLEVVRTHQTDTHYAREITLARQSDGQVVQYGIVRLNLDYLGPEIRQEIENRNVPLGRILIQHDVLRNVRLLSLWSIEPGPKLCEFFALDRTQVCHGRTALIYCNGVPAVELLEVIPPDPTHTP